MLRSTLGERILILGVLCYQVVTYFVVRHSWFVYERRRSQVFGSSNLPCDLCQHVFTRRCCYFNDLNIDSCCDDHGFRLFVLSLLGSHDSVSLCVVLLNKIRFVYDFVNSDVSFCLNHIIFFTSVLLLVLFCQIFMPLVNSFTDIFAS